METQTFITVPLAKFFFLSKVQMIRKIFYSSGAHGYIGWIILPIPYASS